MSWTDKQSIEVIKYIRDKHKIKKFVETGTFKGINAKLQSNNFEWVSTCENVDEYYNISRDRLYDIPNVFVYKEHSPSFLKAYRDYSTDKYIFYLDAHFYNKSLPKNKRFVVLDELDSLKGINKNSIIIIHDFDNGLGHITYDGISLDLNLLKSRLLDINPAFNFYTNTLESCNPVKLNLKDIEDAGLDIDKDTIDNLEYMWSSPRLTYRGILYCLPTKLTNKEMKHLGLRECS